MGERNNTSPENNLKTTIDTNKKIAKGNLAILPLTEKYKKYIKRVLRIYLRKYFGKPWVKNNKDKVGRDIGDNIGWEILSKKIFNGKTITEIILQQIDSFEKKNHLDHSNLKNIEIISGKLYIRFDNGEKIAFDLSAKNMEELVIKTKTKEDLSKAKEEQDITTKIMMWGALISLTYSQFVEFGDWGDKAINNASRNFGDMKKQKFLKSIEVDDGKGGKIKISIDSKIDSFQNGKVGQVEIRNILKKKGVIFNPEKNQFEETAQRKLNKAVDAIEYKSIVKRIKSYTHMDYRLDMRDAGIPIKERLSEKDFEKAKKENIKILKELNNEFNAGKNKNLRFGTFLKSKYLDGFFQRVGGKALHVIMTPIFFKEIHKHSGNLDSYLKGGVEVATFMTGAKFGGKIPGPALLKMISGILAGGIFAVGGHETLKHFDEEFLKAMPNREDYFKRIGFGGAAEFAGWAFGGFINDMADGLNKDVGMNFNNVGLNKVFGLFNGDYSERKYLDIDLFNNNINFGISMIDYLNERTKGIKHWNKEVEEFRIKATREINSKILSKEFKYSDVFEDDNWFGEHSFVEGISDILKTFDNLKEKDAKAFVFDEESITDNFSKKIFEFSKKNIPDDLILGAIDSKNPDKKIFDKIKDKLKIFLKENKILTKSEDIEEFIKYYESIFYKNISEKIDEILGNPNAIESLLGSSGDIHNTTGEIKEGLKNAIIKGYYNGRLEKREFVESVDNKVTRNSEKLEIEKDMSYIEIELKAEIDKLKVDDGFIKEYSEIVKNDNLLLDKALNGEINKESIIYEGDYIFIADKNGKYYRSYGDVKDIIYISSLSENDRKLTKEIFDKILHPEKGNLLRGKGSVYLNEKRKFQKLLENDNYYVFFNRMIDFKRRKVFIENVEKYGDSKKGNEVIKTLESTDIINTIFYISDKIKKALKN